MGAKQTDIAIIGAGMAGLSCASALVEAGHTPVLFDKGRGPGGRMATRRAEASGRTLRFDHGAQFFTARDPRFQREVEALIAAGAAAQWPAAGEDALVGFPSMNAPIKALAARCDVHWGKRVEHLRRTGNGWSLTIAGNVLVFDSLVVAIPAEQAAELLAIIAPDFATRAAATRSAPCWAVMAAFESRLDLGDCYRGEGAVSWAARNGAKPGRAGDETWVIHGSPEWSRDHLEETPDEAAAALLEAFFSETGTVTREPFHLAAHRWRFAMADPVQGSPALWDEDLRLGVAGDWLTSPRVEGAWLSGRELAERILLSAPVHGA